MTNTYGVMRDRITNELTRPDLSAEAEEAILTAIEHYKWKRFWFNEDVVTVASFTVNGTAYYSLPTTILSLDSVQVDTGSGYYLLRQREHSTIEAWDQGSAVGGSTISDYALYQNQIRLWPTPAGVYNVKFSGLIELPLLEDEDDTNDWLALAEPLIRQRAKAMLSIDVIRDAGAVQQAVLLASQGSECLSILEKSALSSLTSQNLKRTTTGRIRAHAC